MTKTISITILRDDTEHEVAVTLEYIPSHRGARDSLGGRRGAGPPLEPDEPAHWSFVSATDLNGVDVSLTDDEIIEATERADAEGEW